MCFAPQRCDFSSLISPNGFAPAVFDHPELRNIWNSKEFCDFSTFSRTWIFSLFWSPLYFLCFLWPACLIIKLPSMRQWSLTPGYNLSVSHPAQVWKPIGFGFCAMRAPALKSWSYTLQMSKTQGSKFQCCTSAFKVWFLSTGPKCAAQRQHWNFGMQGQQQYSRGLISSSTVV